MDQVLYRREGAVEVVTLNRPREQELLQLRLDQGTGGPLPEPDSGGRCPRGNHHRSGKGLLYRGGPQQSGQPPRYRSAGGNAAHYPMVQPGYWGHHESGETGDRRHQRGGGGSWVQLGAILRHPYRFRGGPLHSGLRAPWIDRGYGRHFFPAPPHRSARAKELMFSADEVDARRALELGIVNKVVPEDELMPAAMELAQKLAHGPTRAIGMLKNMLNRSFESDLETALEREAAMQGIAVSTSDVKEGVMSFFEKRPPDFTGN